MTAAKTTTTAPGPEPLGLSAYGAGDALGLWVWLEHHGGVLENVGRELLGKGRLLADQLGAPLVGVLLGRREDLLVPAAEAVALAADEVVLVAHPLLAQYTTDAYTKAFDRIVRAEKPAILLLGATPDGRDLAGRLAVRLYTGLTADCTDLAIEPQTGLLLSRVAGFGGGIEALIKCPWHRPQMATVRPGVFATPVPRPPAAGTGVIRELAVTLTPTDVRVEVLERAVLSGAGLGAAPAVVIGGGGTRGDFRLLGDLAELLGGQVGASRVAVDQGWIGRERQIGQTGTVVRPKLAIACGVSGASQFTVGIDAADTVIAINTDAEAPICEVADYAVVDDLFRVLPPLLAELGHRVKGS
ncbi:MAG: electron transfer flavoprotein subunit alpha/FixB family protein [Chloroflexi bacterium]|nr:electron transfer flavoprotein subunit alpha/FixB family protein [Chloroflexota bacterium]